jgi:hypothetical protein
MKRFDTDHPGIGTESVMFTIRKGDSTGSVKLNDILGNKEPQTAFHYD